VPLGTALADVFRVHVPRRLLLTAVPADAQRGHVAVTSPLQDVGQVIRQLGGHVYDVLQLADGSSWARPGCVYPADEHPDIIYGSAERIRSVHPESSFARSKARSRERFHHLVVHGLSFSWIAVLTLAIRRLVRQLQGTVLWYEQHMDRKVLEILAEELPADQVAAVRLLSGPANLSSKTKKAFLRFAEEIEARQIQCEWRVLPTEQARSLHARVISDDNLTIELPPLNSVLAGTVDSIRTSEIPMETFEEAWDAGSALADHEVSS
jgi:hypothetical protein